MPHLLKSSRIIPLCTIHVFFDDCAMAKYHKERHNITMCHERNKMQLLYSDIYEIYAVWHHKQMLPTYLHVL
jgi:hypothetical protein